MVSSDVVDIITATEVLEVEVSNWQFGMLVELYVYLVEKTIHCILYTIIS